MGHSNIGRVDGVGSRHGLVARKAERHAEFIAEGLRAGLRAGGHPGQRRPPGVADGLRKPVGDIPCAHNAESDFFHTALSFPLYRRRYSSAV